MLEYAVRQEKDELVLKFENDEQKEEFAKILEDMLSDRRWCYDHGIDYIRSNTWEAAKLLYKEFMKLNESA